MIELFQRGGPLMYPLLLASVLSTAYAIERWLHYRRAGRAPDAPERIHALIERGDHDAALALASSTPGPVAAVLAEGIRHRGCAADLIEEAVSLKGALELRRLNENLHVIELIGRLAPLVGLLGTVLGLVEAFRQVAGSRAAVDPSLLAGGIWGALVTTVGGLLVAIPALVVHHLFEDRVKSFAFLMGHYAAEAVKHLRVGT